MFEGELPLLCTSCKLNCMFRRLLAVLMGVTLLCSAAERDEVLRWRRQKEVELRKSEGWLSLVGLEFLKPGAQKLVVRSNQCLTTESEGKPVAEITVTAGKITISSTNSELTLNGAPLPRVAEWHADDSGHPDKLEYKHCNVLLIHRGDRYALRIKDTESARRKQFKGMQWFPVDARYRIVADFTTDPAQVAVPTMIGTTLQLKSPGSVHFTLQGRQFTLTPVLETDDAKQLFFIFKDATASKTTYGAGRFLYTELPRDGKVVLDFNKAENPPCAFTPYATCPRPPKGNVLDVAIEAGEKTPLDHLD
jgi:uncharacterized protein (DUF1684 family)